MTEREVVPYLKLIVTRPGDAPSAPRDANRSKQLAFPYPDSSTVFLVYVELMGAEEFAEIVGSYTPRWIFDVRAVPRLDVIAASRMSAFRLFEKSQTIYVDLFGRLGIRSYRSVEANPAFWAKAVSDLLRKSERKGPCLLLFDNKQLMASADDVLPNLIQPVIGKAARFAKIPLS